jgi:PIN domain nuclease of toxin-antitoxin system
MASSIGARKDLSTPMTDGVLMDTHTALWWAAGAPISAKSRELIDGAAAKGDGVFVSAITAWEVALLLIRRRVRLVRNATALDWFRELTSREGFAPLDLTPEIVTASVHLPGAPPKDPADCFVIATARELGLTLVTRDRAILTYGAAGHAHTLPC